MFTPMIAETFTTQESVPHLDVIEWEHKRCVGILDSIIRSLMTRQRIDYFESLRLVEESESTAIAQLQLVSLPLGYKRLVEDLFTKNALGIGHLRTLAGHTKFFTPVQRYAANPSIMGHYKK